MNLLQVGDYSAWISIDGLATEIYGVERSHNVLSCWIASEIGKNFSVNWYNATREIALQGVVIADGIVCDTHVMLDALLYPDKPHGIGVSYSRTSDYTRRDLVFSAIQVTDDDAYLDTIDPALDIGTIKLELWRVNVLKVDTQRLEHQYGGQVMENQIVHERSKKAGAHHVKFGEEYNSPSPTVDLVQCYTPNDAPCLTFVFKYRPYQVLMAQGLIPRYTFPVPRHIDDARTVAEVNRFESLHRFNQNMKTQGRDVTAKEARTLYPP